MIKILPFEYSPSFKSYQSLAFFFGILQSDKNAVPSWIYSSFIDCTSGDLVYDVVWDYFPHTIIRSPCNHISQEGSNDSIISQIKEIICDDYYINGFYDEYYIPCKKYYSKEHFFHDYILTGFDDTRQVFFSSGYLKNNTYQPFEIPYQDFYKAIQYLPKDKFIIRKVKRIKSSNKFDIIQFCDGLYNYIKQPTLYYSNKINGYHGINDLKSLYDRINGVLNDSERIDLRTCRFIMEHRSFLLECLSYLYREEIPNRQCEEALLDYASVVEEIQIVFNACIKYSITHSKSLLSKQLQRIEHVYYRELNLLTNLLSCVFEFTKDKPWI